MKNIIRIIVLSLLCVACTQDDMIYENQEIVINESEKSRESKMLHFNSDDELKEYVAAKIESKVDLLEEARTVFEEQGRLTLLFIYNNLEKEEAQKLGLRKEEIAKVETSDSMLLYLLNENGEIGIGDKIFRIDGDFVYTYTAGNGEDIAAFFEAYTRGKLKIEDGETIEYGKHLTVYKHMNNTAKEEVISKATRKEFILFNGRRARMVARQWDGHWAFYSSIGSSTKTQEWSQILWWSDWKDVKTDNRLQFTASWYAKDFFEVSPRIKSKSSHNYCNCYEAVDVYDWSAGLIAAELTPRSGVTKHWSHWYQATPNTASTWLYY